MEVWGAVFGDPSGATAILDCVLRRSQIASTRGENCPLRENTEAQLFNLKRGRGLSFMTKGGQFLMSLDSAKAPLFTECAFYHSQNVSPDRIKHPAGGLTGERRCLRPAVKAGGMVNGVRRRVAQDMKMVAPAQRNAFGEFEMVEAERAFTSGVRFHECGETASRESVFSGHIAHYIDQRPVRRRGVRIANGSLRTSRTQCPHKRS